MTLLTLPAWSDYAAQCGRVHRLLVGFSGGVDSTVLLHLARQWSEQSGVPLLAIHVNHQLSPHAMQWQHHCQSVCEQWAIPLHTESVQVANNGQGVEAAARNARYAVFSRASKTGDLLLLGHHRDDQVETVLLRLFRGSGVLGLSGIATLSEWQRIPVLRPLLRHSKAELIGFAEAQGWQWVEDESNASDAFDRNFLRHQVLPVLLQRWPALPAAIGRSAQHCTEAQLLLDELAESDLQPRIRPQGGLSLEVAGLPTLSPVRQRNLVRYWLRGQGVSMPSETQLEQIITSLIPAAIDAAPVVQWPGVEVRRFRQTLYVLPSLSPLHPETPIPIPPSAPGEYPLPRGGSIIATLTSPAAASGTPSAGIANLARLAEGRLTLRFRQGGETCKLVGRPTRPLKKVLQDSDLPPWWRDRLPLVYVDDVIAVIPEIGVCEGFQAGPSEVGVQFAWRPPRLPRGASD